MFVSLEKIPTDLCVEFDGERHYIATPIAESEDSRRKVEVLTSLYPFQRDGYPFHEFQFAIAVTDLETDEVFETCERDMAKGYIPDDARNDVMGCVCAAIPALVEEVQPVAIYRVTKATRPPEKALKKHDLVTQRFQECGFRVTQRGTDRVAREFWVLER